MNPGCDQASKPGSTVQSNPTYQRNAILSWTPRLVILRSPWPNPYGRDQPQPGRQPPSPAAPRKTRAARDSPNGCMRYRHEAVNVGSRSILGSCRLYKGVGAMFYREYHLKMWTKSFRWKMSWKGPKPAPPARGMEATEMPLFPAPQAFESAHSWARSGRTRYRVQTESGSPRLGHEFSAARGDQTALIP